MLSSLFMKETLKHKWPKPGTRVNPNTHEKIRELAHKLRQSYNDTLNALLEEALSKKEAT